MTRSSSQAEQALPAAVETAGPSKKNRFLAFFGFLIFAFAVFGFSLDLFEMGRVFWFFLVIWLLVVRLIIVIKRPTLRSSEQPTDQAPLVPAK